MTVDAIPRLSWQDPAKPIKGPLRKQTFRHGVVHWQGDFRNSTPSDIAAHLRNLQAIYLRERNYSLGYGFAVVSDVDHPDDGTVWEIRGTDLNMASNPGAKLKQGNVNDWTGSVLLIGPANRAASPKAAASVRKLFGQWHKAAGTGPVRPWPHSVTDYTTCCGPHYHADINAGLFDPQLPSPLHPIQRPTPPTDEDDMAPTCYVTDTKIRGTFALVGGRWVPWVFEVPAGADHYSGDHQWLREQILADQGDAAAALWRKRAS